MYKTSTVQIFNQFDSAKPKINVLARLSVSPLTGRHLLMLTALAMPPGLASQLSGVSFPAHIKLQDRESITHYAPVTSAVLDTTLSNGWRHSFDLLLTADRDAFTIFDARGEQHVFTAIRTEPYGTISKYSPESEHSGNLSRINGLHLWTRRDGSFVEFTGSLPTTIIHPGFFSQQLNYRDGRLVSVDRHSEGSLPRRQFDFVYEAEKLSHVRFEGQGWFDYEFGSTGQLSLRPASHVPVESRTGIALPHYRDSSSECVSGETREPTCDTESTPPPGHFNNTSQIPGAIRIDVRPASCDSYFTDYYGTLRGAQIENGLEQHSRYGSLTDTVRSFPIVDFHADGEVRVVRSRDLSSTTLSSAEGEPLFDRLMRDGRDIQRKLIEPLAEQGHLTVEENGRTTTIGHADVKRVVLELIIRYDLANASQIAQIEKARKALEEQFDVVLQVIEIP